MHNLLIILAMLISGFSLADELTPVTDLSALSRDMKESGKPCGLYISRDDCPYCRKLEADVLLPMAKAGELDQLCIVEIKWNDEPIVDFKGKSRPASDIVDYYAVYVTPTFVFVGADGEELTHQLIGYQGGDLYQQILRDRIKTAREWF